ncbi:MAG: hypothetical protein NXH85_11970 [Pseudomonadaceae bacterium]|nr:hypothetical protein [Pseudomonadaceae bacterium]
MIDRLFPTCVDNNYQGHRVALWLFVPVTLITFGRSLVHIFLGDGGAQSIATIPLDTYPPDAADAVIRGFALWGLSQLLLAFLYIGVLWRWRTLVPLMYLLLVVEYVGRFAIGLVKPTATLETPPGAIANFVFVGVGLVMLVLSLRGRDKTEIPSR